MSFWRALGGPVRALGWAIERFGATVQADRAYTETLCRHREVMGIAGKKPVIASECFIAPSANIVGDVSIGPGSAVWYGAIVLGDAGKVSIGSKTQIKDLSVVSSSATIGSMTVVGSGVLIGEGVKVGSRANIGMGATLDAGVIVEDGAVVAPGAKVAAGTTVTAGQLFAGNPAKAIRALTEAEMARLKGVSEVMPSLAKEHQVEIVKDFLEIEQDKSNFKWAFERSIDYDSSLGLLEKNPRAQTW